MPDRKWNPDELDKQQSEFDGTVVKAEWTKGKVFEGAKKQEPPDQLAIEIHPTSYEGERRLAWYNYSDVGLLRGGQKTKWMKFLEAARAAGVDLTKDPHEAILVGKNFHWVEETEEFDIDGRKVESRVLLPKKLNGVGALPEKDAQGKGQPAGTTDLDELILTFAGGDGISIEKLYEELLPKGYKKAQIMARVKNLEKAGKATFDEGLVVGV